GVQGGDAGVVEALEQADLVLELAPAQRGVGTSAGLEQLGEVARWIGRGPRARLGLVFVARAVVVGVGAGARHAVHQSIPTQASQLHGGAVCMAWIRLSRPVPGPPMPAFRSLTNAGIVPVVKSGDGRPVVILGA